MSTKNRKKSDKENVSAIQLLITLITGIVPVWVAIVTCLGTISVAFVGYVFSREAPPTPAIILTSVSTSAITETFIPIEPTATTFPFDTITPSLTYTETLTPSFTSTETPIATLTFIPFPPASTLTPTSGLSLGMQVKITANTTNGRAPLNVTLSAKDSFVRAPDGALFECRKGGCSYIWYVYLNGAQFVDPQETNGTLELKLGKRGNYFVSVYICHGSDAPTCGSGGTVIIVE